MSVAFGTASENVVKLLDKYIETNHKAYVVNKLRELFDRLDRSKSTVLNIEDFAMLGAAMTQSRLHLAEVYQEIKKVKMHFKSVLKRKEMVNYLSKQGTETCASLWSDTCLSWPEFFFFSEHLVELPEKYFIFCIDGYIERIEKMNIEYSAEDTEKLREYVTTVEESMDVW